MSAPGSIPSKPSYRKPKGRNLTAKEKAFRLRVADECKKFCEEPFPNGAEILFDNAGNPVQKAGAI